MDSIQYPRHSETVLATTISEYESSLSMPVHSVETPTGSARIHAHKVNCCSQIPSPRTSRVEVIDLTVDYNNNDALTMANTTAVKVEVHGPPKPLPEAQRA
jgi:hypothetical protein